MCDIDEKDLEILKAIADLGVSYPNADKIRDKVSSSIRAEDLGARLGVLEDRGLVKVLRGTNMPGVSLPSGIYAAGLTDQGYRTAIKRE